MKCKIDWNIWHEPIQTSIESFDIETVAMVAKDYNLNWHATEPDPVSPQSIYSVLRETCEDLITKLISNWTYNTDEKLEHNTYYDDSGVLTEEINMYSHKKDDNVDSTILLPILKVQLRKTKNDNEYWFSIEFVMSSQIF